MRTHYNIFVTFAIQFINIHPAIYKILLKYQ